MGPFKFWFCLLVMSRVWFVGEFVSAGAKGLVGEFVLVVPKGFVGE